MQVTDAVAVVTGGASGLGLATTKALLNRGSRVLMVDLGASYGADFADELGKNAYFAPAGVTNTDAVPVAFDKADAQARQAVPEPARSPSKPVRRGALAIHVVENPMLNGEVVRLDGAIRLPPR